MRSMWKGAISFGLVMIPVKLYAATEQRDVAFRQVHARGRRPDPVPPGLLAGRRGGAVCGGRQGVRAARRRDGRADRRGPRRPAARVGKQHRGPALHPGGPARPDPVRTGATTSSPSPPASGPTRCSGTPWSAPTGSRSARWRCGSASRWPSLRTPRRRARARDAAVAGRGPHRGLPVPRRGHRGPLSGTADGDVAHRLHDRRLRPRRVPRPVPGGAGGTGRGQGRGPRGGAARRTAGARDASASLADALQASLAAAKGPRAGPAKAGAEG